MKKLLALVLCVLLVSCSFALAEKVDLTSYSDAELNDLATAIIEEQKQRRFAEEEPTIETLQKGSKGDSVKQLQQRLIELNYLSGSADGDFGGKTKTAVELFQTTAGLTVTGIADEETQNALYAEDAPKAKVYQDIDFKAMSRDPDAYEGNLYKFSGKVLQVLEQAGNGYTYTAMRIATKGNWDNVVYVIYLRPDGEKRILEDDRVTVYGTSTGLYTYETVMGAEVTLPQFKADTVSVK